MVVHPPSQLGARRVTVRGRSVGVAHAPADVAEFLRRAGLDPEDVAWDDPRLVEWRGGGPDDWAPSPP